MQYLGCTTNYQIQGLKTKIIYKIFNQGSAAARKTLINRFFIPNMKISCMSILLSQMTSFLNMWKVGADF